MGAAQLVTRGIALDPRVKAAADGDRSAAEALLRELLPRARNLIRYLVRGDAEVDDICQDALVALLRGFGSYRGEGALSSWADRVVVRVTFAHLEKVRTDRARRDPKPDLQLVPDGPVPADSYAARREAAWLLDQLPDEQRHALVLHHVLGMTVPEISEESNTPFETVRSRLRLGKQRLRALRSSTDDEPGGDRP